MGTRLNLVAAQNSEEQVEERRPFLLGELGERGCKDPHGDRMARYVDPATVPADQAARTKANMATMRVIAGPEMNDPKLVRRLARVRIPIVAIWRDSDGIVTPAYGAAFAQAFQNGRLEVVKEAGYLPQSEQPAATFALIDAYANGQ